MKILEFRPRSKPGGRLREDLDRLQSLLGEYGGRQARMREEGRRLRDALRRLRRQMGELALRRSRLSRSLARLRNVPRGPGV
ncbi:MAG: hypothetical protein ACRD5D_01660 [Candidatus Polarisedimenticolia bacterium]